MKPQVHGRLFVVEREGERERERSFFLLPHCCTRAGTFCGNNPSGPKLLFSPGADDLLLGHLLLGHLP